MYMLYDSTFIFTVPPPTKTWAPAEFVYRSTTGQVITGQEAGNSTRHRIHQVQPIRSKGTDLVPLEVLLLILMLMWKHVPDKYSVSLHIWKRVI